MPHGEIAEFVFNIQAGYLQEHQIIQFIRVQLLNYEEACWLRRHELDEADLLNGRFMGSHEEYIQKMFDRWNKVCGETIFALKGVSQ